jgi:hypothetical protein
LGEANMDDAKLGNAEKGIEKKEKKRKKKQKCEITIWKREKTSNPRQCASAQGVLPPPLLKGRAGVGFISSSFPRRAQEQASTHYTLYHLHQFFKKPIPGFCAQHSHP